MRSLYLLFTLFFLFCTSATWGQTDHDPLANIQFSHLSTADGLPNDKVWKVFQDSKNYIWIGTHNGLVRWDGMTFLNFQPNPLDTTTILGKTIVDITEDNKGYLWFAIHNRGLSRFDPVTETFKNFTHKPFLKGLIKLQQTKDGILWIGTFGSGMFRYDTQKDELTPLPIRDDFKEGDDLFRNNSIVDMVEDISDNNILWCAGNNGLFKFDKTTQQYTHFPIHIPNIPSLAINQLLMVEKDKLWLATWGGGLVLFDIPTKTWTHHTYHKTDWLQYDGISDNVKGFVHKSNTEFWIQTGDRGGGIFNTESKKYSFFEQEANNPTAIKKGIGNRIFKDRAKRVWFCFEDIGLAYINPDCQAFFSIPLDMKSCTAQKIGNNNVTEFVFDTQQQTIYATSNSCHGLFQINPKDWSTSIIPTENFAQDYQFYNALLLTKNGTVWVGAKRKKGKDKKFKPTLLYLDKQKRTLVPYLNAALDSLNLAQKSIADLYEDEQQHLWIVTNDATLIEVNPLTQQVKSYVLQLDQPSKKSVRFRQVIKGQQHTILIASSVGVLSFDLKNRSYTLLKVTAQLNINTMALDKEGLLWFGTKSEGLKQLQPSHPEQLIHPQISNLPYTLIDKIVFDKENSCWLSTQEGLYYLDKNINHFQVFSKKDGLVFNSFYKHGFLELPNGTMLLGQNNAFYQMQPNCLIKPQDIAPVYLSKFQVVDQPIKKPLHHQSTIELAHDENLFTIYFSSLVYCQADKIRFTYKMEGIHDRWLTTEPGQTYRDFTNVPPGNYQFKIYRTGFPQTEVSLAIIIHPPFWQTWWAYLFYLIAFCGLLYYFYRFKLKQQKVEQQAAHLKAIDAFKTRLFSNITHEFRTPLTLVMGISEQIQENHLNEDTPQKAAIIQRNGQQVLDLVNQILDLRKVQEGKLNLELEKNNVVPLLQNIAESFSLLAQQKGVELQSQLPYSALIMDYDRVKLSQVISNLLSNAIKFTPTGGEILYQVTKKEKTFIIEVKDTGIGMTTNTTAQIFKRYFSMDTANNTGTGIGLALVKELVNLMNGTIEAESNLAIGSTFKVYLPITQNASSILLPQVGHLSATTITSVDKQKKDTNQPIILIVEDNKEVANFIAAVLGNSYHILFAMDGQEGIDKTIELIPDLVISDVMMPQKNGYELCSTLKADERTSHIPIIMLTAKAGDTNRIDGLSRGADTYLTKPFKAQELRIWVENLLKNRDILRARYANLKAFTQLETDNLTTTKEIAFKKDDIFIKKVYAILNNNSDDPDFKATQLLGILSISRTQLHRKLTSLTGQTAKQILQEIRLGKAKNLLVSSAYNISEITHKAGFKDPSHFTKLFNKAFKLTPTEFRNNNGLGN